ncbi:MAG: hypothetical protein LWX07_04705 [Bacteroidetes bacterium]|nr:hypothetical protein [Bacteroidota bacterium]
MKKIITVLFVVLFSASFSHAQKKSGSSGIYGGLGYTLLFFTNADVTDVYPSFDFRRNSLKSEVNPYIGYQPTKSFAFEFSPSLVYTNTNADKGFYYSQTGLQSDRYYYYPRNVFLFMMPINVKVKMFPFAQRSYSAADGIFFAVAGGPMMIREEYDNDIYYDNTMQNIKGFETRNNTMWTGDLQLSLGYSSPSQLAYGFELGYRFVPLPADRKYPLMSSVAGNFNGVIASIKIGYNF